MSDNLKDISDEDIIREAHRRFWVPTYDASDLIGDFHALDEMDVVPDSDENGRHGKMSDEPVTAKNIN